MAHFAEIDSDNKVVRVIVIPDEEEHRGQDFCAKDLNLGGTWLQTSYNSLHGVHYVERYPGEKIPSGKPALRKNYAGIGYTYDSKIDAFIPPKPFSSWIFNKEIGDWESPIPMPEDDTPPQENKTVKLYSWNETTQSWDKNPEL
jgi:hypothetical protein